MMMYRRYITTGMNKKKNGLPVFFWISAAAGSRILYFLFRGQVVVDTYGYFEQAMIRTGKEEIIFYSGLSSAFTRALSGVLRFTGNIIYMAGVWQLVQQILWIILFMFGVGMIFGKAAGLAASGVFIVSPWALKSVFVLSPENYYMFYYSLFLFILGFFYTCTKKDGWPENFLGRLYLNAAGFLLGILCVWSYLGWLLFAILIYVQICNHVRWRGLLKGSETLMGTFSQTCRILTWMLIGTGAAMMRYTGLTGLAVLQQFEEWIYQLGNFKERCKEISVLLMVWTVVAFLTGIAGQLLYQKAVKSKREEMPMEEQKEAATKEQGKVKLLDNPLPVPKKHIRKEIRFDIEDVKLEFDVAVSEDDDFDI